MNVRDTRAVGLLVRHPLVEMPALPNLEAALEPKRKTTLDELNRLFQGNIGRGRDQDVNMIWHDDECVQRKPSLRAVVLQSIDHQPRILFDLKDASPSRGRKSREICA